MVMIIGNDSNKILFDKTDKFILKYKWTWDGKYPAAYIKGKKIRMHTLLLPNAKIVDHINMDTKDNRRVNLRSVTKSQNNINRPIQKNSISGYKGVHQRKDTRRWQSYIKCDSTRIHLGYYSSAIEAAYIYDQVCLQLYGKYARTNFL